REGARPRPEPVPAEQLLESWPRPAGGAPPYAHAAVAVGVAYRRRAGVTWLVPELILLDGTQRGDRHAMAVRRLPPRDASTPRLRPPDGRRVAVDDVEYPHRTSTPEACSTGE